MSFPTRRPCVRRWAGATAVVVATSLTFAACSDADDPTPASGESGNKGGTRTPSPSEQPTSEPASEPTSEPTSDPSAGQSGTAVPIYFAGDGARRTALFREFQRVEGDPLTEAARIVAGGRAPVDPDYRTLWPQMEISSVTPTDGVLLVEIPSDAFTERPDGMSARDARLALQQLVYTLQGVQQERLPVVIDRPDTEARLFGLPTDRPLRAASVLRTLNLVSITSPADGDTVTGDTVTVTGVANSFEASGPCRLIAGGQEVALEPYQADGWMEDRLFPFEIDIPLEGITGEVVVQCETDDPSGQGRFDTDTRRITIVD